MSVNWDLTPWNAPPDTLAIDRKEHEERPDVEDDDDVLEPKEDDGDVEDDDKPAKEKERA